MVAWPVAKLRGRNAETTQAVFLERINWYKKRHLIEANQNASDMTASYSAAEGNYPDLKHIKLGYSAYASPSTTANTVYILFMSFANHHPASSKPC